MNSYGTMRLLEDGQFEEQTDYEKALELYRRLLREFPKGQSRYHDQAQQQIKSITEPSIGIGVANIFLPGSEIQFGLNTRNVHRIDFALYKIDMTRDIRFIAGEDEEAIEGDGEGDAAPCIQRIQTAGRAPFKAWSKNFNDSHTHKSFSEQIRVEGKLPVGAYLLEAKGGTLSARDLVLVSDATLVLKSSGKQELARFSLRENSNSGTLFVTGAGHDRQAFASGYSSYSSSDVAQGWRIYAFTDRPAYRPKETLQWKFIARRSKGGVYSTPANEVVEYQINDPKGTKVTEGKATLNSFGSAWGTLELGEQLPLGGYTIQFWGQGRKESIGAAKLFRLEEYKLPEFKVEVKTPEQDGKKKAFRLGEKVEVEIQADYYFGGPV